MSSQMPPPPVRPDGSPTASLEGPTKKNPWRIVGIVALVWLGLSLVTGVVYAISKDEATPSPVTTGGGFDPPLAELSDYDACALVESAVSGGYPDADLLQQAWDTAEADSAVESAIGSYQNAIATQVDSDITAASTSLVLSCDAAGYEFDIGYSSGGSSAIP